jgi:hypothetical protein
MTQFQNMKNTTSMKLGAPCSTDTHPAGQQISVFPYGTHWFISILANPTNGPYPMLAAAILHCHKPFL